MLCWLSEQSLDPRRKYLVKHTTRIVKALVARIEYRVDINTLNHQAADTLKMNDIGRVSLKCSSLWYATPISAIMPRAALLSLMKSQQYRCCGHDLPGKRLI